MKVPQSILDSVAATYNKPADPTAEVNQTADFQSGYQKGLLSAQRSAFTDIETEYATRRLEAIFSGESAVPFDKESFKEWKRGYWAGRTKAMLEKKKK